MIEILILFALLSIKHFIVDFPLQTRFQYSNKGIYGHLGGITHSYLHGLGTLICVFYFVPTLYTAIMISIIDMVLHYHIDWAKVKINSHYKLAPTTHEQFWWLLGFDQLLHYLTYIAIIGYIAGVF